MHVIGIAGGSGTGKSTIAAHVASGRGGVHVDADRVAHDVLGEPDVIAQIRQAFGDEVIDLDGSVNRRRLGVRVFADETRRGALDIPPDRPRAPKRVRRVGSTPRRSHCCAR